MSGGDCDRTHQNSHCLQWSKSWARDIQWPCRWSQLYCHPDLFSDFMSLTARSLLRPCSCIKHREIFSCMCSVCKKSRNLPKCGAKDWGSCRVCHWPYKHSASHAVDDVSTGPKRGQAQSDIIWYIYRQNQIDNAIHVIDTRLQDQAKSAQIIRFVMAPNCRVEVLICGMSLGVYFGSIWVLQDYESVTGHRLGHQSVSFSWHSSRRHKAALPSISSNRPCHQTLLHSMCIYTYTYICLCVSLYVC